MTLRNESELASTRRKLRELEQRYEAHRRQTGGDTHVRELTMHTLKRYINQLTEEIAHYEARQGQSRQDEPAGHDRSVGRRRVLTEAELANTRRKLNELERLAAAHDDQAAAGEPLHDASRRSLKRLINQLKEEILWTEAHQPARR